MRPLLWALVQMSAYSALLLGVLLLFRRLAGGRLSPALRHGLWFLLVARLLLPVTWASPVQLIRLPNLPAQAPVQTEPTWSPNTIDQTNRAPLVAQAVPSAADANSPTLPANAANLPVVPSSLGDRLDWASALGGLWLAGMAAMAANLLRLTLRHRRWLSRRSIAAPEPLRRQMVELAHELGVTRPPRLLLVPNLSSPCLTAGPRPALMLPADMAAHCSPQQLALALAHELTHLRRGDHLVELLWSLLRCIHWFNPVVWLAIRFVREDMELACDAALAARLNAEERGQYARMLLALFSRGDRPVLALSMSPGRVRRVAEARIRGVFAPGSSHRSTKVLSVALVLVLVFGCFTTACQPTPKDPAIVPKDAAKLDNLLQATAAPGQNSNTPRRHVDSYAGADPSVSINIDADITTPNTAMPVVSVKPKEISVAQAKAMAQVLFEGAAAYNVPSAAAPQALPQLTDWVFHPQSYYTGETDSLAGQWQNLWLNATVKGYHAFLQVGNLESSDQVEHYASLMMGSYRNGNVPMWRPIDARPMQMTQSQAADMVEQKLKDMGIHNMQLDAIRAYGKPENTAAPSNDKEAVAQAAAIDSPQAQATPPAPDQVYSYSMSFVPVYQGVPVVQTGHPIAASKDLYGLNYNYESLLVTVAFGIIVHMDWLSPMEETTVENPSVATIPLDKALDIFQARMQQEYTLGRFTDMDKSWNGYQAALDKLQAGQIDIHEIRLGLTRLRRKDTGAFQMIPAWVFLGTQKVKEKGSEEWTLFNRPGEFVSYAVINAVDGSIIDPVLGY